MFRIKEIIRLLTSINNYLAEIRKEKAEQKSQMSTILSRWESYGIPPSQSDANPVTPQ